MYGAPDTAAAERTAFRRAEKQYKLYKPPNPKGKSRSRRKPTVGDGGGGGDLSAVVDFHALLAADGELPAGIGRRDCAGFDRPVFCFLDRSGFYFIPGALSTEEQCYWIRESLKTFPQPPNRTNLTAMYGSISDLLVAAKNQKFLVEVKNPDDQERNEQNNSGGKTQSKNFKFVESEIQKGEVCSSTTATTLVRKLRWSTLGLQFDWSKRNYDVSLPHNKIPDPLAILAKKMAIPSMPSGEEFKPEAAIVNYYGPSDMLGGHVDDMEADWTKPIVSISLGSKCIFLLGGKTRDEVPTAMFLRSGDIVLMSGEAREHFHVLRGCAARRGGRGAGRDRERAHKLPVEVGAWIRARRRRGVEAEGDAPLLMRKWELGQQCRTGRHSRLLTTLPSSSTAHTSQSSMMAAAGLCWQDEVEEGMRRAHQGAAGVPRIFTESDEQEISALVSHLSGEDDQFILDYIKNSRININIRQVY